MSPTPLPPGLLGSQAPLSTAYDGALLDLDGVCFAGAARVPHAADSVNAARAAGMRLSFVTNNASRAPRTVVDKLRANDIQAEPGEVFSAAMDAAVMLTEHLAPGSLCLVVGGDGVRQALLDEGFTLTDTAADRPAAVVQGWDPAVDWAMLSEGLYAITAGALHVATNLDATLPTERGFALGNGSLVAAIAHASGKEPLAGGKPFPGIYERALARSGATSPIAVGDRLNTDHVGARAASIPGLHVLTGVSTARDVILADPAERPAFLHTDLRGLIEAHPEPVSDGDWWRVGQESARVSGDRLELAGTGALEQPATVTLDAYRALAAAGGRVLIDGADIAGMTRRRIAQQVAVVAQESEAALPLSVRDSVALGRLASSSMLDYGGAGDTELVDAALTRVDLGGLADRLVTRISGGERQRAMVARAIVQQATHLLLDEPTNHLDLHHQFSLLGLVRELDCTTVIVLHDLNIALRHSDGCVLVRDGGLLGQGTPADVITPQALADCYGVNARVERCSKGVPQVVVDGLLKPVQ